MAELVRPAATIHYEVWGDAGPWITLINGHNRPLNDFRLMGRYLSERGRRVLALDNRGSGATVSAGDFSIQDMQSDVAALWDELGVTSTALLGISMGGFIAQGLAASAATSRRLERLILVSTAMRPTRIQQDPLPWSPDLEATAAKLQAYFTPDFAARNSMLVRSMAKQIAKAVAEGDFLARSAAQARAISGFDGASQIATLAAPVLLVHGAEDQIIPVAAAQESEATLRAAGLSVRLTIMPGVGHLLLAECPRELYRLVGEFCEAVDPE